MDILTVLVEPQHLCPVRHLSPLQVFSTNSLFVAFPSSCPYVTGVGATVGINPETAANFSGGGFSNYFARPSYQDDAVQGFISQLPDDFAGTFNSSGRGFPDVAVQGVNFPIVITSDMQRLASGTSASTPAFAAVIAILNDRLLAEGKPVLGFVMVPPVQFSFFIFALAS
jgi:tripeptidyl-peptidase-1